MHPHILLLFGALLLPACTSLELLATRNRPYHINSNPAKGWEATSANADLRVVEFDDQGELWSQRQLDETVEAIQRAEASAKEGLMLIVYVHGWNNSARPHKGGGNFDAFHRTINQMGDAMLHQPAGKGLRQKVFGVFVGWRGRTIKPSMIVFDYFQRRAAAQRVGGPSGTYTLSRLMNAAHDRPANTRVLVGHSFGGLVVERAVAPLIMDSIARGEREERLADLILLLNPAENAILSHQLVTTLKNQDKNADQRHKPPMIVSVAATNDWIGTRGMLPTGAAIGRNLFNITNTTFSGKLRPPDSVLHGADPDSYPEDMSQHTALHHAAPHIEMMRSHKVIGGKQDITPSICETCTSGHLQADQYAELVRLNQNPRRSDGSLLLHGSNGIYTFMPKTDTWNQTRYWILRARPEFLNSHNGLWENRAASGNTIALITALAALR